ncbi:efflux RND transporter periplasmic adaptor subunit [Lampropedia puyangensis]|uniref:Efflux RND transporter periplasmic adaptor subunit n=1 Tax=Lampropedia puyangensis TaxID=1330072 RepID=A0A4S8FFC0_9BURK|nr:efflux RND transporter periplasmic adaptor subunit [Lampropedia puyangensis]
MGGLSLWWLAPAIGLAVGAASFLWQQKNPPSPTWLSAPVVRGNIEATVAAVGTLQPLQSVEVGAQVSGQIMRLLVSAGDTVEQGQLLAEIDASVIEATVEAGRAEIKALQAQLADARAQRLLTQSKLERQQLLHNSQATPREAMEEATANHASAVAKIDQLQAQIQQLKARLRADEAQLGYTRIVAPIAGTVTSVDAKLGQTLNATYQTPTVLRLADLSRMQVWTQVSEADIGRVRSGQTAWFTTLGSMGEAAPRQWHGRVKQVLPAPPVKAGQEDAAAAANTQAVQYTVLFDVANDDGALMPQMTAQVVFVTASAQDVLLAPLGGLQTAAGQSQRYEARVLDSNQQVQTRTVRIGKQDRLAAEVLDGLREGENLITGEVPAPPPTGWLQW